MMEQTVAELRQEAARLNERNGALLRRRDQLLKEREEFLSVSENVGAKGHGREESDKEPGAGGGGGQQMELEQIRTENLDLRRQIEELQKLPQQQRGGRCAESRGLRGKVRGGRFWTRLCVGPPVKGSPMRLPPSERGLKAAI